jgi:ATP-dependent DNA helicase RecQ
VPPYVIFHDRTLTDLARARPSARERLADIGGIGRTKLDRYGPALLRLIADHPPAA